MRRFQSTSTYLPHFHLLSFTVICVLSFLFFPPLVVAKSGTLFYHAHDFYRTIPEAGGLNDSAAWLIDLSGAPANAIITSVDVEYWIDHTWVGDLKVWLTTEHNGEWQDYVLWDLEGGSDQDIHEKETGLTTWNGLPANRRWYLCAADFAEQDEGRIKEWKIWVHFDGDGRTLIPQVGPYSQDFTLGKPDGFQGWEYYSTNEGRIQVVNGQLRMDDMVNGSAYSLNEAILHLDLRGRSEVILTLDHFSSVDENDSLPSSFMGHSNGDGILISADGTNWYLLTNLTSDFQQQSFDLDAAIQSAGISYSSDFRIKFQQYDDSSWPEDGRAFDNISITTKGHVPPLPSEGPFGTWMGTFNSTSYGTSGTISNWIMREDYTTEGKWELHVGANTGFRIHPSGTYSFSPANNHLDFLYTGLATVWVEGQITDVPCILDVNGTVFQDNASGSYMLKLFPSNLLPFSDTGTWQATRIPNVVYHVFGIEICTGWNYNDPNLRNDSTYDFCLALETDNTISHVDFLTPAGYTFQIPGYTHMQSNNIQTWHYELAAMPSETPSTAGLVAHWKMDDNAATTSVVDSSGKGNHGTAQWNTSTLSTPGKINGALTFDGKSDYIDCGNNSSLDLTNNFTIAAWVKPYSFSWLTGIVSKYHTVEANSYYLRLDLNPPYNKVQFGGKSWATSLSSLNANQWYFVVGMRDSGIGKIYINGNLDVSSAVAISSSSDPVYIGMDYQPDARYFYGVIDDVMIFNRTLSEAEIKALHVQPIGSKEYWRYEG
ncbi:MAG: LamG-like jellyroll fold domain-containing protein, partial [Phycisphaerae bacterium]